MATASRGGSDEKLLDHHDEQPAAQQYDNRAMRVVVVGGTGSIGKVFHSFPFHLILSLTLVLSDCIIIAYRKWTAGT
jgi:hypothetical protein